MKLGLDLHGVISDIPEVFKFIMESIIKNGGEVHILTGTTTIKAVKELSDLGFRPGVHYNHLFSIVDYHLEEGTKITGYHEKFQNPEFDDELWDKTKGDYCKENEIGLHIDDSLIYKDHFSTPFARLWTLTNTPKIDKPDRLCK